MKISKKTNFIELPSTTKKSRPIIDPHPKSLIIRIKLDKNGGESHIEICLSIFVNMYILLCSTNEE